MIWAALALAIMTTMSNPSVLASVTSIVDNQGENTLHQAIERITTDGRELWIATAYFSLDALNLISQNLLKADKVRLIYGGEANARDRNAILAAMRSDSEERLLDDRKNDPLLSGLVYAKQLIEEGRLEARIYRRQNFHAKLYISHRQGEPPVSGIVGSGNFTRSGLTQNVELNLKTQEEQTLKLVEWYESKWAEAEQDDFTEELRIEIERHLNLYSPHAIYLKALLAWGDHVQGRAPLKPLAMLDMLDPHQEHAYRQALRILEREPGVMICDGVGLGKSFVALALMEHWLSQGSRVLLVAPKAILKSSWEGYLARYLGKYSRGFANVHSQPMTWFGFNPDQEPDHDARLAEYAEQADVVIIDESHNFRNSATQRYDNLYRVVAPNNRGRKKIVLLTATPINTKYEDLSNQLQILTHDDGTISGIPRLQINRQARNRDRTARNEGVAIDQETLFSASFEADELLSTALESVAIQRSRHTCRELAEAAGKRLRFPKRRPPQEIRYTLGQGHEELIRETKLRFEELSTYLERYSQEVAKAAEKETEVKRSFGSVPQHGLKFSGYLPNLFRRSTTIANRQAQLEAFLAKMVFVNVIKQLESSTPAFQSIIESLGQGLALRLRHYCGDDPAVIAALARHEPWIKLPANRPDDENLGAEPEDGAADEASGGESDDFICREERRAIKRLQALGFSPETHDIERWKKDILQDLNHLETIHGKCLSAQREPDAKLNEITAQVQRERAKGRKVLIFTQSRKTADYVQNELAKRLDERVALVNSDIGGERRARILHEFSPKYNDLPGGQSSLLTSPEDQINILVSTDVLAEGVNLQEAGCIINYDLHWNPTRLIQRIGRVDRRLRDEDPDHEFDILNVFPPPAINEILGLVDTVEQRKRKISHLLGIDVSYFRSDDEEGTLREFNALYEGGESTRESQLIEYVRQVTLNTEEQKLADSIPPGGFGVWENAPEDGYFALFTIKWAKPSGAGDNWKPSDTVSEKDLKRFGPQIGAPRLLFLAKDSVKLPRMDSANILEMLSATERGEPSGKPSDQAELVRALQTLRRAAFQSIHDRTQAVSAELVCWMECRRS